VRAPVGIVERKLQRTYVHDSKREGNEGLAVGCVVLVIDDEGASGRTAYRNNQTPELLSPLAHRGRPRRAVPRQGHSCKQQSNCSPSAHPGPSLTLGPVC
jgi:hypothetical protein